jgi:hypothetical protein
LDSLVQVRGHVKQSADINGANRSEVEVGRVPPSRRSAGGSLQDVTEAIFERVGNFKRTMSLKRMTGYLQRARCNLKRADGSLMRAEGNFEEKVGSLEESRSNLQECGNSTFKRMEGKTGQA